MTRIAPALSLCAVFVAAAPAAAFEARYVMENMTQKERFGYVLGLADMLSYQYVLDGNRARGQCITDQFYSKTDETWKLVLDTFKQYPDKPPEGLVVVLMNKRCGKK